MPIRTLLNGASADWEDFHSPIRIATDPVRPIAQEPTATIRAAGASALTFMTAAWVIKSFPTHIEALSAD
jgi:hypothetical protein